MSGLDFSKVIPQTPGSCRMDLSPHLTTGQWGNLTAWMNDVQQQTLIMMENGRTGPVTRNWHSFALMVSRDSMVHANNFIMSLFSRS